MLFKKKKKAGIMSSDKCFTCINVKVAFYIEKYLSVLSDKLRYAMTTCIMCNTLLFHALYNIICTYTLSVLHTSNIRSLSSLSIKYIECHGTWVCCYMHISTLPFLICMLSYCMIRYDNPSNHKWGLCISS